MIAHSNGRYTQAPVLLNALYRMTQEPIPVKELSPALVTFCDQSFDIRSLLGINPDMGSPEIAQFEALIKQLETNALIAQEARLTSSAPVYFSGGRRYNFLDALERMAAATSWQLKFSPSAINTGGFDVSVILPH